MICKEEFITPSERVEWLGDSSLIRNTKGGDEERRVAE
jgi:hypothetical protein